MFFRSALFVGTTCMYTVHRRSISSRTAAAAVEAALYIPYALEHGYRTHDRSPDDLEIIYEELVHIRALSHLSTTVKRELANIIVFESHPRAETVRKFRRSDIFFLFKKDFAFLFSTFFPFPIFRLVVVRVSRYRAIS